MPGINTSTPSPKVKTPRGTRKTVSEASALHGIQATPSRAIDGMTLTPAEIRLIKAFRNICYAGQEMMVRSAERSAQNPALARRVKKPAFRLIAGGVHA